MQMKLKLAQNKRVTGKEQYYTPSDTANDLTIKMLKVAPKGATWLEPAGGTGQFIEAMVNNGIEQIVSYDIEPHHNLVQKTDDFLNEDLSHLSHCVTLTNPPFGRANKLSVPFFNKCAEVSDYIGFLVPKSWRKWSVINRLNFNFHLVYDEELSIDFIYNNEDEKRKGNLATVFQIWERRSEMRDKITVSDHKYITKTTPDVADVSLTVFGRGCGTVKTEFPRVPNTTQMFLKLNADWVLDALKTVDFARFCNNVAFIQALSIQEINCLLNEYADAYVPVERLSTKTSIAETLLV